MIARLLLVLAFVAFGFVAGVAWTRAIPVVTGAPPFPALASTGATSTDAATPRADQAQAPQVTPALPVASQSAAPAAALTTGPDFTRVAAQAVKAVANISSVQVIRTPNSPFANDPFFRYFFGEPDDFFGYRSRRSQSLGSGVVVSPDGYIVTNNHVIAGEWGRRATTREVTVTLADKREIRGAVVGLDAATDIALLRIDVAGLPALLWGDSSRLQVGEWVLAIGSPFQLSQTVTAGIVSATGRANLGFTDYEDFIQTDAAINPGNSGGALVNGRGELVGINTGIFSQSGGYQGIGFAVPSILARRIVDDLAEFGEVRRGTILGIAIETVTPPIAAQLNLGGARGAVVVDIDQRSDAWAAGLRRFDVIVGFNGNRVEDTSQLFRFVADARIGSNATVTVLRARREIDLRIPIVSASRVRA